MPTLHRTPAWHVSIDDLRAALFGTEEGLGIDALDPEAYTTFVV
jgi:hypothetical protein